ncbi:SH3 domain-containing protein [bacterium]|nr:SH3 domain-containing protein [bacterium]
MACKPLQAQHHLSYAQSNRVYIDEANVRDQPSLNGEVIAVVKTATALRKNNNVRLVRDTIAGKPGVWYQIRLNKTAAYVWSGVLADGLITSKIAKTDTVLFAQSEPDMLEFKVFRNGNFLYSRSFKLPTLDELQYYYNFGVLWNSNGKEIWAMRYREKDFILFEWDGNSISRSQIKLSDESILTGQYADFADAIINASGVNLRAAPNDTATVLGTLPQYSGVEVVQEVPHYSGNDKREKYWHAIKYKDTTAYIFGDYLDMVQRCINNNRAQNQQFVATHRAVYASENDVIVDRLPFLWRGKEADLIDFGNQGFGDDYQFIAMCYSSFTCGAPGGDRFILWKDHKLKYFGDDYGVGDGGYSDGHFFTFPNEKDGIEGKIVLNVWSAEILDEDPNEVGNQADNLFTNNTYIMEFINDTLVEVPSKHSRLRDWVTKSYPGHQLMRYWFYDINDDGLEDAVFYASKNLYYSDVDASPFIGYCLGSASGAWGPIVINESIIQAGFPYFNCNFKFNTLYFDMKYNAGMYADKNEKPLRIVLEFRYDKAADELLWYAKQNFTSETTDHYSFRWVPEPKVYFKTNRILFENSWATE